MKQSREMITFIRANQTRFGGAEIYLSRLSSQLKKQGVAHKLVHSNIPKWLPSWVRVLLFNTKVCFVKNGSFYFSLERISCPDIYRAGDGVHKVFIEIEKKSFLNPLHLVYLYLEKKAFHRAKKIIAISNMVKKNIIDSYEIDSAKIAVIYNGISLQDFDKAESMAKLKQEFTIKENEKIILYVGSGFQRKGVASLLKIVAQLQYTDFKVFIVGKEKKIDYYKNLASSLMIADKVFFTGPRTDVNDFYAVSDIFLFPTKYEPFGSVVLEAMNFANVVFTTKSCGGGEILDSEYLMDSPDDLSVVPKIDALLFNEEMLQRAQKKNLETVKHYTIERNVEETLKVIDEVVR